MRFAAVCEFLGERCRVTLVISPGSITGVLRMKEVNDEAEGVFYLDVNETQRTHFDADAVLTVTTFNNVREDA